MSMLFNTKLCTATPSQFNPKPLMLRQVEHIRACSARHVDRYESNELKLNILVLNSAILPGNVASHNNPPETINETVNVTVVTRAHHCRGNHPAFRPPRPVGRFVVCGSSGMAASLPLFDFVLDFAATVEAGRFLTLAVPHQPQHRAYRALVGVTSEVALEDVADDRLFLSRR